MNTQGKQSRNNRLLTAGLVLLSASTLMAIGQTASANTVDTTPTATSQPATGVVTTPEETPAETADVSADTTTSDVPTANLWGVTTQLKLQPEAETVKAADTATTPVTSVEPETASADTTATDTTSTDTTTSTTPSTTVTAPETTTPAPVADADNATSTVDNTATTAANTDVNLSGETSTPNVGVNSNLPTDLTVANVGTSTDKSINPTMGNGIYDMLTNVTSFGASLLLYPLVASRQMTQVVSWVRTLLSPGRYDISTTWTPLADTYNPAKTQSFYTEAQNWYDNEVTKENWSVPTADGKGQVSGVYLKNGDSTKTVIYGQGWTTEPQWMGYVSKVFYDMGYNVLMTYTQGQSKSSGEFITFGAKDGADWTNWINKVNETNGTSGDIVLFGQSLGADVALQAAAQPNLPSNVKAVIADAGYSTLPSLLYSLYSGVAGTLNGITSKIGWNLNGQIPLLPFDKLVKNLDNISKFFNGVGFDDASGLTAVQNSTLPTLFISTTDDSFIPTAQTQALYNQSNATLKQLWLLTSPVGGHASATNAVEDYQAHVQAFMQAVDAMNNGATVEAASTQALAA